MAVGTYLYLRSTKPPPTCECQHAPTQEQEEVFDRIAGREGVGGVGLDR